jgi:hypothetical protein
MSQHTINQQFGQLNAPDNGLKALQVQREELNDGDSSNHPGDAGQAPRDVDDDVYSCTGESTIMISASPEQSQPTTITTDMDVEWEIDVT